MRLIKEEWNSYLNEVLIPTKTSSEDIRETKRIFYAGSLATVAILLKLHNEVNAEGEDEVDIAEQMTSFRSEHLKFREDLLNGEE